MWNRRSQIDPSNEASSFLFGIDDWNKKKNYKIRIKCSKIESEIKFQWRTSFSRAKEGELLVKNSSKELLAANRYENLQIILNARGPLPSFLPRRNFAPVIWGFMVECRSPETGPSWSVPHRSPPGTFIKNEERKTKRGRKWDTIREIVVGSVCSE